MLAFWKIAQVDSIIREPTVPRLRSGHLRLDLLVFDNSTLDGVDQEHLSRLQLAFAHNL